MVRSVTTLFSRKLQDSVGVFHVQQQEMPEPPSRGLFKSLFSSSAQVDRDELCKYSNVKQSQILETLSKYLSLNNFDNLISLLIMLVYLFSLAVFISEDFRIFIFNGRRQPLKRLLFRRSPSVLFTHFIFTHFNDF